jgi:hypothetical protein
LRPKFLMEKISESKTRNQNIPLRVRESQNTGPSNMMLFKIRRINI